MKNHRKIPEEAILNAHIVILDAGVETCNKKLTLQPCFLYRFPQ